MFKIGFVIKGILQFQGFINFKFISSLLRFANTPLSNIMCLTRSFMKSNKAINVIRITFTFRPTYNSTTQFKHMKDFKCSLLAAYH